MPLSLISLLPQSFVLLVTCLLTRFLGSASGLRFKTRDEDMRIARLFNFHEGVWFTTVLNNWVRCSTFTGRALLMLDEDDGSIDDK